mmetsp:Transcript_16366/g.51435  ORF Transcript_16366/g.51435 Transcript_16366/m.51435 type:complete len:324 (-) Transcript_16366:457-1428(-)
MQHEFDHLHLAPRAALQRLLPRGVHVARHQVPEVVLRGLARHPLELLQEARRGCRGPESQNHVRNLRGFVEADVGLAHGLGLLLRVLHAGDVEVAADQGVGLNELCHCLDTPLVAQEHPEGCHALVTSPELLYCCHDRPRILLHKAARPVLLLQVLEEVIAHGHAGGVVSERKFIRLELVPVHIVDEAEQPLLGARLGVGVLAHRVPEAAVVELEHVGVARTPRPLAYARRVPLLGRETKKLRSGVGHLRPPAPVLPARGRAPVGRGLSVPLAIVVHRFPAVQGFAALCGLPDFAAAGVGWLLAIGRHRAISALALAPLLHDL